MHSQGETQAAHRQVPPQRARQRGNPKQRKQAELKDTRDGATRSSVAGKAGRHTRRGNPHMCREAQRARRRQGGNLKQAHTSSADRIGETRQLEPPSPAVPEDAASGATRRPHQEVQLGHRSCEATPATEPEAPKDEGAGVTRISIAGTDLEPHEPGRPGD